MYLFLKLKSCLNIIIALTDGSQTFDTEHIRVYSGTSL